MGSEEEPKGRCCKPLNSQCFISHLWIMFKCCSLIGLSFQRFTYSLPRNFVVGFIWSGIRNPRADYRMGLSPTATFPLPSELGGWVEKSPFIFQTHGCRSAKVSIYHIWDVTNKRSAVVKASNQSTQIEHNICGRRAVRSPFWWLHCICW